MAVPGLYWIELGLGVVLLFITAKAHGRQIRLERELEGHFDIDFMGENHPWVEALWRKDRRQFWIVFPVIAVALSAYAVVAVSLGLPPRFGNDPLGLPLPGAIVLAGLLWALSGAFATNGLASALRFRSALRRRDAERNESEGNRVASGEWSGAAVRGTFAYGGLVAGLIVVIVALAVT